MDDLFPVSKLTIEEKETNYNIRFCPPYQFESQSVGSFPSPGIALDIHGVASLGEIEWEKQKYHPCNERGRHLRAPNERNLTPIKCKHRESQPTMVSMWFSTVTNDIVPKCKKKNGPKDLINFLMRDEQILASAE